jgi:hypothetical protein
MNENKIIKEQQILLKQYEELHLINRGYGSSSISLFEEVSLLIEAYKPNSILDYGCGKGILIKKISKKYPRINCIMYDPCIKEISKLIVKKVDLILNTDVLEHIPEDMIDNILKEMASLSNLVFFQLAHGPASAVLPNGENAHCTIKPPEWYHEKIKVHFPNFTPLPSRGSGGNNSVVITANVTSDFIAKYYQIINKQKSLINKYNNYIVKKLCNIIPFASMRRKVRDRVINGI